MERIADMEPEVTVICVDNTALVTQECAGVYRAQAMAIALYCVEKLKAHPDNKVGLVAMGEFPCYVEATGNLDVILTNLKGLLYCGTMDLPEVFALINFLHSKIPKRRLVVFSGGRLSMDSAELECCATQLKEYGVAVDVVNFGIQSCPRNKSQLLKDFVSAVDNGGNGRYLYAPSG